MVVHLATFVTRSSEPVKIRPGIYDYKYDVKGPYRVEERSKNIQFTDSSSTQLNSDTNITLSAVMRVSSATELNRLVYVEYMGTFYKVQSAIPYPPRVSITLGNVETEKKLSDFTGGK